MVMGGPEVEAAVGAGPAAEVTEEVTGAEASDILRKAAWTGRKFLNESLKKLAADFSKSRRNKQSMRSMRALPRNCARNTAWATRPTRQTMRWVTTRSS